MISGPSKPRMSIPLFCGHIFQMPGLALFGSPALLPSPPRSATGPSSDKLRVKTSSIYAQYPCSVALCTQICSILSLYTVLYNDSSHAALTGYARLLASSPPPTGVIPAVVLRLFCVQSCTAFFVLAILDSFMLVASWLISIGTTKLIASHNPTKAFRLFVFLWSAGSDA